MQKSDKKNPSNVPNEDKMGTSMNRSTAVPTATGLITKSSEEAPRNQFNAGKNTEQLPTEMDVEQEVAEYFDRMEEEIPDKLTIESVSKNAMGGSAEIKVHNPNNPAEVFVKAANNAYQLTQEQLNAHNSNINEIINRIQEDNKSKAEHMKQIEDEFNKHTASITENTNSINEIKDLLKQTISSIAEIKLILEAKTNNSDMQLFASKVDEKIDGINSKHLNTQINSIKNELDAVWESRDDDLIQINKTNELVTKLLKEFSQVNKQIDQLNNDITEFQNNNQIITKEINDEIKNKVNQIKKDVNNKISQEQVNIFNNINNLDKKNSKLFDQFNKFKEQLTLNIEKQIEIQEAIKQYEFDKIIASQDDNKDNFTQINQSISTLTTKYNDLVIKYSEISKSCQNQGIKNIFKEVTLLKNKLDNIYKNDINKQVEYKFLVTSKPKTKILFEFDFDPATGTTIFKPKKKEYVRIINALINKKLMTNKGKEKINEEDISIGNLSAFDSETSFIGNSTIKLKLDENEEKIHSHIKSKTSSLEEKLNQKIKELSHKVEMLSKNNGGDRLILCSLGSSAREQQHI
ncbi:hypothetical protein BCR32DRAFT_250092 [Anaeromyces robustus]|uniref:Uncharacterized protein n=1 Tax=Anaeromyces robustus TaxID=1754192 RepID=A0A1Y1WDU7_9FUNG|nr:hypothetical protein BCR32DRAFT_250092 [Anaeromyces robustus]|eukprot:ORX71709.1 hypothetical protein BCR32DRAFT_250092 [Anaeromyces robustus]